MNIEYNSNVPCNIEEYFANLRETYEEKHINTYESTIAEMGYSDFPALIVWCEANNIDPFATEKDEFVLIKWVNSWHN